MENEYRGSLQEVDDKMSFASDEIQLYDTDYVIIKDGVPISDFDIVYHYTSIIELFNDGFNLEEGEEIISMTKLPQELQDKYIATIKENK